MPLACVHRDRHQGTLADGGREVGLPAHLEGGISQKRDDPQQPLGGKISQCGLDGCAARKMQPRKAAIERIALAAAVFEGEARLVQLRGMALGGACELIMHSTRAVAALESYIGLVEAGVGLLPAGGGTKELVLRASEEVRRGAVGSQIDALPFIRTYFQTVATATVARSAIEAKELGFLRPSDVVVMHPHEVLHVAIGQARAPRCRSSSAASGT